MKKKSKKPKFRISKSIFKENIVKNLLLSALSCLVFMGYFISCASSPAETFPASYTAPPERPARPAIPELLMGTGIIPAEDMAAFLVNSNTNIESDFAKEFALIYKEEASMEGINHDVAFAQMLLETGYLRFGNLVLAEQNNFAGLGATGPGHPGLSFPDARTGVRAQIQHLKAYASDAPLNQDLVNPRYFLVRLGSAPAIKGLAGTWAADPLYADKINNILERLYFFSFGF